MTSTVCIPIDECEGPRPGDTSGRLLINVVHPITSIPVQIFTLKSAVFWGGNPKTDL